MSLNETTTQNRANLGISIKRMTINDASQLPKDFATTPGGTFFSTTPGGMYSKLKKKKNLIFLIQPRRNSNSLRSNIFTFKKRFTIRKISASKFTIYTRSNFNTV
jgi:hypothetical protein